MADDDWQLEALHEQFGVFEQLAEPCSSFAATDLREIINKVSVVIRRQMRMKSDNINTTLLRHISAELIKALPEKENNLHLSYIVIVTNENVNGNLCKMPVFRVLVGDDQHTFVDIRGSVYRSWDAFMKNTDLPDCKFCYPVNGCYNVRGSLKVDFALSPAASTFRRYVWWSVGGVVVGAAAIAASFFFEIPAVFFTFATTILIPIAEQCLPTIVSDAIQYLVECTRLVQFYRSGKKSIIELGRSAFKLLSGAYSTYNKQISLIWEEIKKVMFAAYNYLLRVFARYFETASNRSQHDFLANVVRIEEELSQAQVEAGSQLNQLNRDLTTTESPVSTLDTVMVHDSSYNRHIFQNCQSDSTLQDAIKNHKDEDDNCIQFQKFKPTTERLLTHTQTVADQTQVETLSDVKDIFESLSFIIKVEYKMKVDSYIKGVRAAMAASEKGINLDAYNRSYGIVGDPKDHLMLEAIESIQEDRLMYRLKEKIKEIQSDEKVVLIPIYKKSADNIVGVYKCIGIQGKGKVSAQWLLKVLKESLTDFEEETLVINEKNSVIYIRSEEISIFAYQEVNGENTSEGIVYVNRI